MRFNIGDKVRPNKGLAGVLDGVYTVRNLHTVYISLDEMPGFIYPQECFDLVSSVEFGEFIPSSTSYEVTRVDKYTCTCDFVKVILPHGCRCGGE